MNDLNNAEVKEIGVIGAVNKGLYGFGGFLYLVVIGMFLSLCGALVTLTEYISVIPTDDFKMLTDRNESSYSLLWTLNFWTMIIYCIVLILFVVVNFYLCYKQKRLFRWMMIAFYVWCFIGNGLIYLLGKMINNDFGREMVGNVDSLLGAAVYFTVVLAIWGTYFMVSRRVKNTFIL